MRVCCVYTLCSQVFVCVRCAYISGKFIGMFEPQQPLQKMMLSLWSKMLQNNGIMKLCWSWNRSPIKLSTTVVSRASMYKIIIITFARAAMRSTCSTRMCLFVQNVHSINTFYKSFYLNVCRSSQRKREKKTLNVTTTENSNFNVKHLYMLQMYIYWVISVLYIGKHSSVIYSASNSILWLSKFRTKRCTSESSMRSM